MSCGIQQGPVRRGVIRWNSFGYGGPMCAALFPSGSGSKFLFHLGQSLLISVYPHLFLTVFQTASILTFPSLSLQFFHLSFTSFLVFQTHWLHHTATHCVRPLLFTFCLSHKGLRKDLLLKWKQGFVLLWFITFYYDPYFALIGNCSEGGMEPCGNRMRFSSLRKFNTTVESQILSLSPLDPLW